MARDVFFLDHRHAEESGGDDSASKTNAYEASLSRNKGIRILLTLSTGEDDQGFGSIFPQVRVDHFSTYLKYLTFLSGRQGKYTRTGDIVVLCAYLGQLAKVRKLLSNEVATVIDERDAVQLINHEDNDEAAEILVDSAEQVQVSKRM